MASIERSNGVIFSESILSHYGHPLEGIPELIARAKQQGKRVGVVSLNGALPRSETARVVNESPVDVVHFEPISDIKDPRVRIAATIALYGAAIEDIAGRDPEEVRGILAFVGNGKHSSKEEYAARTKKADVMTIQWSGKRPEPNFLKTLGQYLQ